MWVHAGDDLDGYWFVDLGQDYDLSDFELVDQLSRIAGVRVPKAIEEIRTAPVLHDRVIAAEEMPQAVKEILGV